MDNFISLTFYLSLFFLSAVFIGLGEIKKRGACFFTFLGLLVPIMLAAVRYDVGTDFFNYRFELSQFDTESFDAYLKSNGIFEIVHFIIGKLAIAFGGFSLELAIYAIITVIVTFAAIRLHRQKISVALSFFLFLCIYYPISLNLMKQMAAVSIVAFSFRFVFERDWKRYTIGVLVASMFHTTAIVTFPIYFLWNKSKNLINKWKITIAIIGCVFIAYTYQSLLTATSRLIIFNHYALYVTSNISGHNREIYLELLLVASVFMLWKPLTNYDVRNKLYILLMLFSLIFDLTGFSSPFVKRIGLYFGVAEILVLPSMIYLFKNTNDRILIRVLVSIYPIAYFTLVFYLLSESNVIPYHFIW